MVNLSRGYKEFREALKERESSNNYRAVNEFNFRGAYQFGGDRLWDLGISIDGYIPRRFTKEDQKNKIILSTECFLSDKDLQDRLFKRHVQLILRQLRNKYSDSIKAYTESGLVAGVHLKGFGGLNRFLKGVDNRDALGTAVSEYVELFAGYDLSEIK